MKKNYGKALLLICSIILAFTLFIPLMSVGASSTVEEVISQLEKIDTLQQMQNKRNTFTVSKHYNASNASIVASHEKAKTGYETYLSEMFAARKAAQEAFESLSEEEKAEIPEDLKNKLDNTLDTTYNYGTFPVNKSEDEYCFQIVSPNFMVYEVSSAFIKTGDVAGTFVVIDAKNSGDTFTLDTPYSYGKNNYELAYCCDLAIIPVNGTHYKRTNLENSEYYDSASAEIIRAVVEKSYPFLTMDEMKQELIKGGLDKDLVASLNRSDIISAVQMAIWAYANVNDENYSFDNVTHYGGTLRMKNHPYIPRTVHDYSNEIWDWYSSAKPYRTFDAKAEERVNKLTEYLCSLAPVKATKEQTVISHVEVVDTKLLSEKDGVYDLTVYVTLDGGGSERDNLDISAVSYKENADGTLNITQTNVHKAVPEKDVYSVNISARDGDTVKIGIEGEQYLAKGVYFYKAKGGREASQYLVGVSEGETPVKAEHEITFTAPEYTLEAPESVTIKTGEKTKLNIKVIPEIGAPEIKYTSSDENIVTVDDEGCVTAVAKGEATITAELPNGKLAIISVTVKPSSSKKHYVVFGKTEKIGWYSVSLDGGKNFQIVFGNSNLVIEEGTELIIKAVDIFGDPFTFYVNGKAAKPDENGYIRVKVEDYVLIGALGIPLPAPDAEESLNLFQKIIKGLKDFFELIKSWFVKK